MAKRTLATPSSDSGIRKSVSRHVHVQKSSADFVHGICCGETVYVQQRIFHQIKGFTIKAPKVSKQNLAKKKELAKEKTSKVLKIPNEKAKKQ